MSYKPSEIVKRAKQMKKDGVVYGYGYKYEKITAKNLSSAAKMFAYTSSQLTLMKKKIGKIAIDCSGFVNRAAGTNLGGSSEIKSSSPATYPIADTSHRKNGMFIWRDGHIGLIYSSFGKWYIIEAASTASDITIRSWSERAKAFTCYGKIKGVAYGKEKVSYKNYTEADFVREMRKIIGLSSTASRDTILRHTPTISIEKNRYSRTITALEKRLKALGYYSGKIEADEGRSPIFGENLKKAVIKYQKKKVHPVNTKACTGGLSAEGKTWSKLLGL